MTTTIIPWPLTVDDLEVVQRNLAARARITAAWSPRPGEEPVVGAAFVVFPRQAPGPGTAGDPAWVGAAAVHAGRVVASAALSGEAGAPYAPGLLALREGALLEAGCRALDVAVDVVLVDATGGDHPRRAGLALHLGAVLELPTVGVTDRTLQATAAVPGPERGAWADLRLDDELVGYSLRTRQGARPVFVHAAWRTTPDVARDLVMGVPAQARTPMPLREARRIARRLRAGDL